MYLIYVNWNEIYSLSFLCDLLGSEVDNFKKFWSKHQM